MSTPFPIPTFEDIRRALQFWIDQQDKWFYFEAAASQNRSTGETDVTNPLQTRAIINREYTEETIFYLQTRVVGKIGDVINFPPSLMLNDSKVFTVEFYRSALHSIIKIVSEEDRSKYGLVFSQITYYEPVEDEEAFLNSDPRVNPTE